MLDALSRIRRSVAKQVRMRWLLWCQRYKVMAHHKFHAQVMHKNVLLECGCLCVGFCVHCVHNKACCFSTRMRYFRVSVCRCKKRAERRSVWKAKRRRSVRECSCVCVSMHFAASHTRVRPDVSTDSKVNGNKLCIYG